MIKFLPKKGLHCAYRISSRLAPRDGSTQGLIQVSNDVVSILQANTDTDEVVRDAQGYPLLLLDGRMGHEVGQLGQALVPAQGFGKCYQLKLKEWHVLFLKHCKTVSYRNQKRIVSITRICPSLTHTVLVFKP